MGNRFHVELDVLDLLWRVELPNSHISPNSGQKLICRYECTAQSYHLSARFLEEKLRALALRFVCPLSEADSPLPCSWEDSPASPLEG